MLEDQDLELLKDMAGVSDSNSAGINFNPNSKEDYDELRNNTFYSLSRNRKQ